MKVWVITLISTFILCYMASSFPRQIYKDGYFIERPSRIFAFFACAVLVFVSGFRAGIGDTASYKQSFTELPTSFSSYLSTMKLKGDWGFDFVSMLIKVYIKNDPQVMIFFWSFVIVVCAFIALYRYSCWFELSVFLFITTGVYLTYMNGIRQSAASAVLFLAFPLIYKRKWYLYFPLILLVGQLHKSAYIFFLLYFVVNRKAWGKATAIILAIGVLLFISYPVTGSMLAKALQESQYAQYGSALTSTGSGANMIRPMVMFVPVFLSFVGRRVLIKQEKFFNILVNFSVINMIFMLLATKFWIYARLNMYFSPYMILLLCACLRYIFTESSKKIIYILCLVCYGLYYWYEMYISLGYNASYVHFIKF